MECREFVGYRVICRMSTGHSKTGWNRDLLVPDTDVSEWRVFLCFEYRNGFNMNKKKNENFIRLPFFARREKTILFFYRLFMKGAN